MTASPSKGEQVRFLENTINPRSGVAGVPESYYRKALDLNRFSNSVANKLLESYRRQIVKAVRELERIDKMPSSKKPQFKAARMRALIKQNLDAMKKLPTIPGFHVTVGQRYEPGDALKWLQAFGVDAVPMDQHLPTLMAIRVHDWGRDWTECKMQQAAEEGLALGYEVHVNYTDLGMAPTAARRMEGGVVWTLGNSTDKGSGARTFLTNMGMGEIQDDAGIRGAIANAKAIPDNDTPIAFHCYGDQGAHPAHLALLRKWYPQRKFTITELHWGFRGHGRSRADKPHLYTAEAGAYIRGMVIEAYEQNMAVCLFQGKDFFESDGMPTPSMLALRGDIEAKPYRARRLALSRLMGTS